MQNDLDEKSFIFVFWKPLLAYVYVFICLFDFVLAPVLQPSLQHYVGIVPTPWVPLTLNYGGVFHLAIGGILGATAWTHGMANIEAVKNMPDYSNSPYIPPPDQQALNVQISQTPIRHHHADFDAPPVLPPVQP